MLKECRRTQRLTDVLGPYAQRMPYDSTLKGCLRTQRSNDALGLNAQRMP